MKNKEHISPESWKVTSKYLRQAIIEVGNRELGADVLGQFTARNLGEFSLMYHLDNHTPGLAEEIILRAENIQKRKHKKAGKLSRLLRRGK